MKAKIKIETPLQETGISCESLCDQGEKNARIILESFQRIRHKGLNHTLVADALHGLLWTAENLAGLFTSESGNLLKNVTAVLSENITISVEPENNAESNIRPQVKDPDLFDPFH